MAIVHVRWHVAPTKDTSPVSGAKLESKPLAGPPGQRSTSGALCAAGATGAPRRGAGGAVLDFGKEICGSLAVHTVSNYRCFHYTLCVLFWN